MAAELSITAKGQITLKKSVLDHLGVSPGQKVDVRLLPNGRVELRPTSSKRDLSSVFGILKREGQRTVSIEEMQDAIEAGACGEP
ncbi:MAG: transcriptional regulator [Caulobacter sp. 35-67-4]|nr:MAG: transcriptional regulator [Caulobacter sp. 32-67-35]OYX97104.1 MAG: transcriptional regulator [Caulobacter sp. 35-67-4]OZA77399.1 MAG: transcriptional regulator [Caulobacter sp. 39-67-4]HQR88186.1 AbrB/MazE/SpoVT family DNA-binding domain-containing protein [Caulobacter sp.]